MSLYKRGGTWWINITTPNGQRVRCSAKTLDRKAALELHDRLKAKYWRVTQIGEKPHYPWQDAVKRWLNETEHKASRKDDIKIFRMFHQFLSETCLDEIDNDLIEGIIEKRKQQGVANATINRALALLRAVLRRAMNKWDWLDKVPSISMLPEPKRRVRWLTHQEVEKLLHELPEHLEVMARFTLATGLRDNNVTQLEWSQVDFERRCAWSMPINQNPKRPLQCH